MKKETVNRLASHLHFAYPCRPWRLIKIDASLVDEHYYQLFNQWHRGVDINGIGGGDTDLGLPVQSMFPGTVVELATPQNWAGYGQTVLVRSEDWVRDLVSELIDVDLEVLDVQYAHLHQVTVDEGDRLAAGDHLGSIGKGDRNQYPAHLHLEVRRLPVPVIVRQGGTDAHRDKVLEQCLDPEMLFEHLPFADYSTVMPHRRIVAPVWRLVHNDGPVEGERTIIMNHSGRTGFLYDERTTPPKIESWWDAFNYSLELWRQHRP